MKLSPLNQMYLEGKFADNVHTRLLDVTINSDGIATYQTTTIDTHKAAKEVTNLILDTVLYVDMLDDIEHLTFTNERLQEIKKEVFIYLIHGYKYQYNLI